MKDSELRSTIDQLRAALADLSTRVGRLEVAAPSAPPPSAAARDRTDETVAAAPPAPAPPPPAEEIPEHIVLAISAAVAAFLGERAHIRTVRLIRSAAWAQQGRVSIQASHRLRR